LVRGHLVCSRTRNKQAQESVNSVAIVFFLTGKPRLDIGDWLSVTQDQGPLTKNPRFGASFSYGHFRQSTSISASTTA
jgi:hypothetical protein